MGLWTAESGLVKGKEATSEREREKRLKIAMVKWCIADEALQLQEAKQAEAYKCAIKQRATCNTDSVTVCFCPSLCITSFHLCPSLPWSWSSNMGGTRDWLHMASYPLPSKIINAMVWQGKKTNRRIRQHGQVLNAIRHQTIMQYNAIQEYWQDCNTASSSLHEHKTMKSSHMNSVT